MTATILSGDFISSMYLDVLFQDKYQTVDIEHGSSQFLRISSSEEMIEGGEVYDLQFFPLNSAADCSFEKSLQINSKVEGCYVFHRIEWYSPIYKIKNIIGNNPRILQFSKINNIPPDVKGYRMTTCGYLLEFEDCRLLIFTSDYPGCIEITTDTKIISQFDRDYTKTTLTA